MLRTAPNKNYYIYMIEESKYKGKLKDVRIILGIGNPGKKYEKTYHSAGLLFIGSFLKLTNGGKSGKLLFSDHLFDVFQSDKFLIARSKTFMNESGQAAAKLLKKFGTAAENIIVAHDDSDILIGKYKITKGGGAAGHNGIISIIRVLKTRDFLRFRVGIREENTARKFREKAGDFVLKKITKRHMETLEETFKDIIAEYTTRASAQKKNLN